MLVPFPCRERVEPLPTSDEREAESQDGELDRLLFTKGDDERQESGVGGEEGEDEGFLVGGCGGEGAGGGGFFGRGRERRRSATKENKMSRSNFVRFLFFTVHSTAATNSESALRAPGPLSASLKRFETLKEISSRTPRA